MTDQQPAIGMEVRPLGLFAGQGSVGAGAAAGAATYDPQRQQYQFVGAGSPNAGDQDQCQCLWQQMTGDFILHAQATVRDPAPAARASLGWTVRATLDADAAHVSAVLDGTGHATLQYRRSAGAAAEELPSGLYGADVVQLERQGTHYRLAAARFGEPLSTLAVSHSALDAAVYVALFVATQPSAVRFSNVRLIVPAPAGGVAASQALGSQLEILEVASGQRQLIYSAAVPFEAPNWTPDGAALLYNSAGHLYRFDLASKTAQPLDTGFAIHNNNDHVLSFDGTQLGISHHNPADQGHSIIYTLPSQGGTPQRVTAQGPSYLHGWSPDGRFLVYTGMRAGAADIYRIAVAGGAETRLTQAPGLNDGAEYTPDGRFIYFNSVRTGRMQIWRMQADGSQQEPVTDDPFNNWFPHISPDGQQIVFLSYGPDVAPGDHPPYKQVYLRTLAVAGGIPRVVAYVYGGQGTINVPSWSPNSRYLAFVSNSGPLPQPAQE